MPTYLAKDYVVDTADTDFVTVDGFDVVSSQFSSNTVGTIPVVPEMITLPAAAVPITGRYRISTSSRPDVSSGASSLFRHAPWYLNGNNVEVDYTSYLPPNGTTIFEPGRTGTPSGPQDWEVFEWGGVYLLADTEIGFAMWIASVSPTITGYLHTIKVELLTGNPPTEGRIVGTLNRTTAFINTLSSGVAGPGGAIGVQEVESFTTTDDVAAGETVMMITCDRNFDSQPFSSGHQDRTGSNHYWYIDGYPFRNTTTVGLDANNVSNLNESGNDGGKSALDGLNSVGNSGSSVNGGVFLDHHPTNELQDDVPSGTDVFVAWGPHTTFGWGTQLSTPNRIAVLLAFNAKANRLTTENNPPYAYTEDTEFAEESSVGTTDNFDSGTRDWVTYWSPYYTLDVSDETYGIGQAAYRRYYVVATVAQQHGSSAAATLTIDGSDGWTHIGDVDTGTGTAYGIKLHIYWRMFTNGGGYPRFRGTFDRAIGWGWTMTVQQCLEQWDLPIRIHLEGARSLKLNP